ncbi:hypothetical protein CORC01_13112, partial [Colletotrichum orchidophilum]
RLAIYIYILNNKNLFLITKLFYIKPFIIIKSYNNFYLILYKVFYLSRSDIYYVAFIKKVINYILYIIKSQ